MLLENFMKELSFSAIYSLNGNVISLLCTCEDTRTTCRKTNNYVTNHMAAHQLLILGKTNESASRNNEGR